jgi:KDO2-lipid IV(A) lauroyltransferase
MVQALRANQWIVGQKTATSQQLDKMAQTTLHNITYAYYTLFHYLENVVKVQSQVDYSSQILDIFARSSEKKAGLLILGLHMCYSDFIFQLAAQKGLQAILLSLPQPTESVEWQHSYRRKAGIDILPASISNIRQVIRRLAANETVLTGLDRPMADVKYRPRFFGYPAHVPVHYIPVALKAKKPVVLMSSFRQPDGRYLVQASDIFYLKEDRDREVEILRNAEMVLEVAETFIKQAPQQWAITQPVWPELVGETPK